VDQPTQETPQKKAYVQPSLEKRDSVDEVIWGQNFTTTGFK
jgi:hypothetical protein